MAWLCTKLFFLASLTIVPSHAAGLPQDGVLDVGTLEERACHPSTAKFENPGFEAGKLSPWTWHWTNHSVPMTAKIVKGGYKSRHSLDIHSRVQPWFDSPSGSTQNTGYLRQKFKMCKDGHYRVQWYYRQVPGSTKYSDSLLDSREFAVFMDDPTGYSNWLGDFTLYKTYSTCAFCGDYDKHYSDGDWHKFSGTFYADQAGEYTLVFRSYVSAFSRDKHNVETEVQIDSIGIKRIGGYP